MSISTTNLFDVSNIPLSHDLKAIRASEKVLPVSGPQHFQEIPLPPSDTSKVNTRLHSQPMLSQQLYHPSSLQPSHDFELVKEITLQPRIKASPRAAFLNYKPSKNDVTRVLHQSTEKSGVPNAGVTSSATKSSLVNNIPERQKSHPTSDPVFHKTIIDAAVDVSNGDQKQLPSIPFLSLVNIRFAFLNHCLCYTHPNTNTALMTTNDAIRLHKGVQQQNPPVSETICKDRTCHLQFFFLKACVRLLLLGYLPMALYTLEKSRLILSQNLLVLFFLLTFI
jgi:hypothetical protein